jgi:hypothetical protein
MNFYETDIKSALTILAIAWQTLALFPVLGASVNLFSSEWSFLHRKTASLVPGETDKVSTMNAGLLDQIRHAFLAKNASSAFRTAFVTLLAAMALHNVAPASLSISSISIGVSSTISIGNITGSWNHWSLDNGEPDEAFLNTVVQLEQLFATPYASNFEPKNCSVGFPSVGALIDDTTLSYSTEAVCWRRKCRWAENLTFKGFTIPSSHVAPLEVWSTPSQPDFYFVAVDEWSFNRIFSS